MTDEERGNVLDKILAEVTQRLVAYVNELKDEDRRGVQTTEARAKTISDKITQTILDVATEMGAPDVGQQIIDDKSVFNFVSSLQDYGAYQTSKKKIFEELLLTGLVQVVLDARKEGVVVPEHHREDYQLRLNFSMKFNIEDFVIDDEALSASLSFDNVDFHCVVPWTSIWGMIDPADPNNMLMFIRDVPAEIEDALEQRVQSEEAQAAKEKEKASKRSHLSVAPENN